MNIDNSSHGFNRRLSADVLVSGSAAHTGDSHHDGRFHQVSIPQPASAAGGDGHRGDQGRARGLRLRDHHAQGHRRRRLCRQCACVRCAPAREGRQQRPHRHHRLPPDSARRARRRDAVRSADLREPAARGREPGGHAAGRRDGLRDRARQCRGELGAAARVPDAGARLRRRARLQWLETRTSPHSPGARPSIPSARSGT